MKKQVLWVLLGIFFIFSYSVYGNENFVDKDAFTNSLILEMNKKFDELEKEKKISKEEILPYFKEKLQLLQQTYNKNDVEYDIIQKLIDNLQLSEGSGDSQEKQEDQENESQNEQSGGTPTNPNTGIGGEISELEEPLSPEEKQKIENYLEGLKQEEKQNQEFNKPGKRWGTQQKNTDW